MQSKLTQIFAAKKERFVKHGLQHGPGLGKSLRVRAEKKPLVIAEIKRESPSLGVINETTDILDIARAYKAGGASAISVLTEEDYFGGSLNFLAELRAAVDLPLLRKDFLFHPDQMQEAVQWGADGALLIASFLDETLLEKMIQAGHQAGLWVLVEGHDLADMHKIAQVSHLLSVEDLVGINNRNLHSLTLDLRHGLNLWQQLSKQGISFPCRRIAESGFFNQHDLQLFQGLVDGFLIGSSLMQAGSPENIELRLKSLSGTELYKSGCVGDRAL